MRGSKSQLVLSKRASVLINIFRDSYLISAAFITSQATQTISIVWMSRPQNFTVVSTCIAPNWTCVEVSPMFNFSAVVEKIFFFPPLLRLILKEHRKTNGWTFYLILFSLLTAIRLCYWREYKKQAPSILHILSTLRLRNSGYRLFLMGVTR